MRAGIEKQGLGYEEDFPCYDRADRARERLGGCCRHAGEGDYTPPPPVYTWTGCYVGAGIGYGMWNQNHRELNRDGSVDSGNSTSGGRGWFGTGQIGCDYQVASSWVIGAFADYERSQHQGRPQSLNRLRSRTSGKRR